VHAQAGARKCYSLLQYTCILTTIYYWVTNVSGNPEKTIEYVINASQKKNTHYILLTLTRTKKREPECVQSLWVHFHSFCAREHRWNNTILLVHQNQNGVNFSNISHLHSCVKPGCNESDNVDSQFGLSVQNVREFGSTGN